MKGNNRMDFVMHPAEFAAVATRHRYARTRRQRCDARIHAEIKQAYEIHFGLILALQKLIDNTLGYVFASLVFIVSVGVWSILGRRDER